MDTQARWISFVVFLELDLIDFKPVIAPASLNTALVKATFKPKNKASSNASGEWTAKDRKI